MGDTAVISDAHRFSQAAPQEDVVYGACSPGWHSAVDRDTAVEQWIEMLQRNGIERVCCLMSGRHLDASDSNLGLYREAFGEANVLHVPVPDHHLLDANRFRQEILPFLSDADSQNEPVVVHCLSGLGRTGQVLAAWLVAGRGYTPLEALETVRTTGRTPMDSVERGHATRRELFDLLHLIADRTQ
ncbi:MAG: dual specificity protein phosphatase family protein [Halovenus sp.]